MTIPDPARLFPRGSRVLCALSAGPDSMVLTHMLASRAEELGITVAAAHFSHGLRPEDAGRELEAAQKLCRDLKIALFYGAGDTRAQSRQQGQGLEDAARTLRYRFLRQTGTRWQADWIATGHHRDDQAETVLFRLCRGTGTRGLGAMAPRGDGLCRPLLDLSREDILEYARAHDLAWVTDPTNLEPDCSRNLLRLRVLPLLEQVHPGAAAHLAEAASLLRQDEDFLQSCTDRLLESVRPEDGGLSLPLAALREAHPALRGRAVRRLAEQLGFGPLSLRHVQNILALADRGPSAETALPGGLVVRRAYDRLIFGAKPEEQAPPPRELFPGDNLWGGFRIRVSRPGCTVRSRKTGDRVLWHGQERLLKKLLINEQVPRSLRDRLPVICRQDQSLICGLPPFPNQFASKEIHIEIFLAEDKEYEK